MDKKQITSHQLYSLTATISLGGSIIVSASTVASVAKHDAWLAALITVGYGMPVMLLYYYLGSKYPGMTLIGITKKILGKWLGLLVSAAYTLMFLTMASHLPYYINGYFGRLMHETPAYYINMFFVAGVVIAVFYGIEAIARASEIMIVIFSVFFAILIVLLIKDIKIEYMTPVMENGLLPVLKGSVFMSPYITYAIINLLMIFPRHISNMPQAKKALLKGFLWSGSVSFASVIMSTLILGSALTAKASFPTLMLAAEINFGGIITRLEYILTIIWLFTQFMIGLAFFYSGITALSELLGLTDHKKITLPFGLVALVFSGIVFPSTVYQGNWINTVYTPLITTFGLFIPLVLMIVHIIRKKLLNNLY